MIYGACWYRFNEPGCFIWARVTDTGRVYVFRDHRFIHQPAAVAATAIKQITDEMEIRRFTAVYADPTIFPDSDDPKIIEAESPSQTFARAGLPMIPAGSNAPHGWSRIHDYLRDAPDGKPWLLIDRACTSLIRTLPSLTQATNDPDDCEGELYAAHALRLLLSARPAPSQILVQKPVYPWGTIGWLKQREAKASQRSRRLV